MREALEKLQEKHQIIKGPQTALFPQLNDAATRWRMMCKAIFTLKSNDANHASIQEAIDLIELPLEETVGEPTQASVGGPTQQPVGAPTQQPVGAPTSGSADGAAGPPPPLA